MKILHIEDQFYPDAGYQLNFLAKYNRYHGHETLILATNSTGSWGKSGIIDSNYFSIEDKKFYEKYNIPILRLKSYGYISGRVLINPFELVRRIRKINPDVILFHGLDTLTGIIIIYLLGVIKKPMLLDSHMVEAGSQNKFRNIFRLFYSKLVTPIINKHSLELIAVDKASKDYCVDNFSYPSSRIEIIPLGTDMELFQKYSTEIRKSLRQKYNINEDEFVFIYTGKITSDKKLHLLAEAIRNKIQVNNCMVHFVIVAGGSGEYYDETIKTLESSENKVSVFKRVPVNELVDFYNISDVAIWPGGCSLSFFDAQACGLPAIVEEIDANVERIVQNNGFLFKKESAEDLRLQIIKALTLSESAYNRMSMNSVDYVSENFSYDLLASKFEEKLKTLL